MRKVFLKILSAILVLTIYQLPVFATNMDKSYDIYMAKDIVIDGKLDDWDAWKHCCILLPEAEESVSYFSSYAGPSDLSALLWLAWSNDGLYLASEVTDDVHFLVPGITSWSGDSIQLAFGVNDIFAPEFSLNSDATLFKTTNDSLADPSSIQFQTSVGETKIVYEAFFPWAVITTTKPDDFLPFSIIYNENDGAGRVGWIELSPGIAVGKTAFEFPVLKLKDESPEAQKPGSERPKVKDLKAQENNETVQTIVFELKVHITYPDVKNHWAREYIEEMASRGVLRGKGELYDPEGSMTRAELLATAVRAAGLDQVAYNNKFNDVTSSDWYADYIQAADDMFLTDCISNDGFIYPNNTATRGDMIRLLSSVYLHRTNHGTNAANEDYLGTAIGAGLISESADYRLNDAATRAEIATVVFRLVEALNK